MRELTSTVASALAKGDPDNAKVMLLRRQGLGYLLSGSITAKNASKSEALVDPSFTVVLGRLHEKERRKGDVVIPRKGLSPVRVLPAKAVSGPTPASAVEARFTLPNVSIVDASHNELSRADELWEIFPACWWVNLSNNKMSSVDPDIWPLALGELDLSHNALSAETLFLFSTRHIMRLRIEGNPLNKEIAAMVDEPAPPAGVDAATAAELAKETKRRLRRICVLMKLPNLWVIDDDYVSCMERRRVKEARFITTDGSDDGLAAAAAAAAAAEAEAEAAEAEAAAAEAAAEAAISALAAAEAAAAAEADEAAMDDELDDSATVMSSHLTGVSVCKVAAPIPQLQKSQLAKLLSSTLHPGWGTRQASDRVSTFIKATQSVPPEGPDADDFRLDVLLDDYLEQARVWNKHAIGLQPAHERRRMPTVDPLLLFYLPHHQRLDVSVLLTASLVFDLPRHLVVDTFVALLGVQMPLAEVDDLLALPAFVKTALISLVRRVSRRERLEFKELGHFSDKPRREAYPHLTRRTQAEAFEAEDPPESTYQGPEGFTFLRPILEFLHRPLHKLKKKVGAHLHSELQGHNHQQQQPFSEIELEILRYLPDVCTRSTRPIDPATSYRDWLAFASRHAVLLMTRSQYCPSLTRAQVTIPKQEMYSKLLPILRAASMTYEDLELSHTGADKDGRVGDTKSTELGTFVPFGTGLPKGQKHHLLWNKRDLTIIRDYRTPWSEYYQQPSSAAPALAAAAPTAAANDDTDGAAADGEATDEAGGEQPRGDYTSRSLSSVEITQNHSSRQRINSGRSQSPPHGRTRTSSHEMVKVESMSSVRAASLHSTTTKEFVLPRLSTEDVGDGPSPTQSPTSWRRAGGADGLAPGSRLEDELEQQQQHLPITPGKSVSTAASFQLSEVEDSSAHPSSQHHWQLQLQLQQQQQQQPGDVSTLNMHAASLQVRAPPEVRAAARKVKGSKAAAPTKAVRGFTADAAWDAAFLLAPPRAVRRHNRKTADETDKWTPLNRMPVLLHPSCPPVVPNLLDETEGAAAAAIGAGAPRLVSSPVSRADQSPRETPAAAARRLLAEMGTLRNLRGQGLGLGAPGAAAKILAMAEELGPGAGAGAGAGAASYFGKKTHAWLGSSASEPKMHPVLGALLLQSGGQGERERASGGGGGPSTTYLTGLPEEEGEGDGAMSAAARQDVRAAMSRRAEEQDAARTAEMRRFLTTSLSSADLLRMQLNYPELYSGGTLGRDADMSSSGRTLNAARYPRFNKVVYTLDKKALPFALMRIAEDAGYTATANAASEQHRSQAEREALAPSLFQNSELTLQAGLVPPRSQHVPLAGLVGVQGITRTQLARGDVAVGAEEDSEVPPTMTDSVIGFSSTGGTERFDSREAGAVTAAEPEAEAEAEEKARAAEGASGSSTVKVPGVQASQLDERSLALSTHSSPTRPAQAPATTAPVTITHDAAASIAAKLFVRQPAKALRPLVVRNDPEEQSGLPARGRLLSVPHLASARLPLNTSFKITRKPAPVPAMLLAEALAQPTDSVVRFDAQGKRLTA